MCRWCADLYEIAGRFVVKRSGVVIRRMSCLCKIARKLMDRPICLGPVVGSLLLIKLKVATLK